MRFVSLIFWNDINNIGDLLSPFIINRLSGIPVKQKEIRYLNRRGKYRAVYDFLRNRIGFMKLINVLFSWKKDILGIGSILSFGNNKCVIWGSGFMNYGEKFEGGKVCAVRGPLSNEQLIKNGFKGCSVFGDPALLLPLIIESASDDEKIYDVAIIPHWSEYDFFYEKYGATYKILDVRTTKIEDFVHDLTLSKHILSSSLHGIILSHAYNIPAIWIKHHDIETDGFKFYDYFSSVEIPFYNGIMNFDAFLCNHNWRQLFVLYKKYSLPRKNIKTIQRGLISVAPFKVLSRFKY